MVLSQEQKNQALAQLRKRCIALSGSMATGKSTALSILKDLGYTCFSADELAREVCQKGELGFQRIKEHFGERFFHGQTLSRSALRQVVFTDVEKKKLLESLLHPLIHQRLLSKVLQAEDHPWWLFYEVPLLFEKKAQGLFKASVVVACQEEVQKKRLKLRDTLSDEGVDLALEAQMPLVEKISLADYILDNNEPGEDSLKKQIIELLKTLDEERR